MPLCRALGKRVPRRGPRGIPSPAVRAGGPSPDAPGRRPRSSCDRRSGRGAAPGLVSPEGPRVATPQTPPQPGDCSGARGPCARRQRSPLSPTPAAPRRSPPPPRQLAPRSPCHSPSSPRRSQGRGGGSRPAPSLLSCLLTAAGRSHQARRRRRERADQGAGTRARARGPNTAAHVTRRPPLLRNGLAW